MSLADFKKSEFVTEGAGVNKLTDVPDDNPVYNPAQEIRVSVDFEGREDMYKKLEKAAKEGFRTLEGQILYELSLGSSDA